MQNFLEQELADSLLMELEKKLVKTIWEFGKKILVFSE